MAPGRTNSQAIFKYSRTNFAHDNLLSTMETSKEMTYVLYILFLPFVFVVKDKGKLSLPTAMVCGKHLHINSHLRK